MTEVARSDLSTPLEVTVTSLEGRRMKYEVRKQARRFSEIMGLPAEVPVRRTRLWKAGVSRSEKEHGAIATSMVFVPSRWLSGLSGQEIS